MISKPMFSFLHSKRPLEELDICIELTYKNSLLHPILYLQFIARTDRWCPSGKIEKSMKNPAFPKFACVRDKRERHSL
jgi:hypothetical protein